MLWFFLLFLFWMVIVVGLCSWNLVSKFFWIDEFVILVFSLGNFFESIFLGKVLIVVDFLIIL